MLLYYNHNIVDYISGAGSLVDYASDALYVVAWFKPPPITCDILKRDYYLGLIRHLPNVP